MAHIGNLIVTGKTNLIGNVGAGEITATKFKLPDGVSSLLLLADGNTRDVTNRNSLTSAVTLSDTNGWNKSSSIANSVPTMNTIAYWDGSIFGNTSNLTKLGNITVGTWNATTISATKGGTGLTSYTKGDILYANGSNALAKLNISSTNGQVLTVKNGVPVWQGITASQVSGLASVATGGNYDDLTNKPFDKALGEGMYDWYTTMIDTNNDTDNVINRWKEVVDFLANITETPTLTTLLLNKQDKVLAKGSTTLPVYIKTDGNFDICTQYAGGTLVKLNNADKIGVKAEFYAPTGGGNSGEILKSNGTGAPTWTALSSISAGLLYVTSTSTNKSHYLTFVDSNNSTSTAENFYTNSSLSYNPSTGVLTTAGLNVTGRGTSTFKYLVKINPDTTPSNTVMTIANVFDSSDKTKIYRSIINFSCAPGSNDNGYIYHETCGLENYTDKGVIHICPADGNSNTNDYVTIHGYDHAETIKLFTNGNITTTGQISSEGRHGMWYQSRDNAFIAQTTCTTYTPMLSIKTANGSWALGTRPESPDTDKLIFAYITDTDVANKNNTTVKVTLPAKAGDILTTGNLGFTTSSFNMKVQQDSNLNLYVNVTNSDTVDGLHIATGRNNLPNQIVRTDGDGKIQAGWINTTSGALSDTQAIAKVYCSFNNDNYIRYKSFTQFVKEVREADITTITKTLTLTTSWQDTGIENNDLPKSGTYIIQLYDNNSAAPNSLYAVYYSGIMSWHFMTSGNSTNDNFSDEIVLHRAAHAMNGNTIYLRTVANLSDHKMKLLISYSGNGGSAWTSGTYTFKFKKII